MKTTSLRNSLTAGTPQLGLCIMYPSPGVVERIGRDWDWIWIDGQHGELGYNDVLGLVRACDLVGTPAFVRVPGHEFGLIGQALDTGAAGVIVPCVDTPAQAQRVVDAAKFPPLGKRSYGSRRVIDLQGRLYSATANDDVWLMAQIETPEAIENVDAIAGLPGVDALFLGPDDIALRRGLPMDGPRNKETLGPDMEAVVYACRKHNKIAVTVGGSEALMALCLDAGFEMIVGGGDVAFLATGSKEVAARARAQVEKHATQRQAGGAERAAEGGGKGSLY